MSFTFPESSNSLQHASRTQYIKAYVHAKLDNIITRHKDEPEAASVPKLCSKTSKHKTCHANDRTTPDKCSEQKSTSSRDIHQILNPNILQQTTLNLTVEQFNQSLEHYHNFPLPTSETPKAQSVNELFRRTGNPCPLVLPSSFVEHIRHVSEVLHIAIRDIIRRWWTDEEAKLWERIPVDSKIEELLRWLADPSANPELAEYNTPGSWRPDFLIPVDGNGIQICEINSRFVMNGAAMTDQMQSYLLDGGKSVEVGGRPMTSMANNLIGALDKATQVEKPLFIIRGRESGYDINVYQHSYLDEGNKLLAKGTIIVHPGDLCTTSPFDSSENKLFVNRQHTDISGTSAALEVEYFEIDQLILELHQDELLSLPLPILKQIAKRTVFNDLRTIFLVHDKRMLGIIRQELPGLTERNILTNSQAILLTENIAETLIPTCSGYTTLYNIFDRIPEAKNNWLFKPAGRGKGEGIVFGANVDEKEWTRLLYPVNRQTHILQRRTKQRKYNLMMPGLEDGSARNVQWPLVGSFFIINGKFEGIIGWRASADDVCALSRDGKWMGGLVDGSI